MIKLIVSDVDGTLLPAGQSEISGDVICAIKNLIEAGKKVAIASGRTYGSLIGLFPALEKDVYFICCDGSACVYDGKVIYTKQIGIGDVLDVIRRKEYEDYDVLLCTPKNAYILKGNEDFAEEIYSMTGEKVGYLSKMYDLQEPVIKIIMRDRCGNAKPLSFMPKTLRVSYNKDGWCEYVSAIANKGLAVSDLQMRLYLSKFDTACIGDGYNDAEMMKKAKLAVSANNYHEDLEGVCNAHTDDVVSFLNELLIK